MYHRITTFNIPQLDTQRNKQLRSRKLCTADGKIDNIMSNTSTLLAVKMQNCDIFCRFTCRNFLNRITLEQAT